MLNDISWFMKIIPFLPLQVLFFPPRLQIRVFAALPLEPLIFSSTSITFLFIWLYQSNPPPITKTENTESL